MGMNTLSEDDARTVRRVLIEELDVAEDRLTRDAHFEEDLGADSLTRVEIALSLEDRLGLSIPDERWEQVATVGDLHEVLAELLAKPGR